MVHVDPHPSPWESTWIRKLANRYGHRTLFLALLSFTWFTTGVLLLVGQPDPADHLFHTYLPVPVRAALWVIPAVGAMVLARSEWEWVGFVLVCLGPAQRACSYAVGMGFQIYLGHPIIAWDYSGRLIVWLLVILLIWVAADWPNSLHVDEDGELHTSDGD